MVKFFLLHMEAVFTSVRFFLTAKVSHGTLDLAFCLVGLHSAAASKWAFTKFSFHHSEYVFMFSSGVHRICFIVLTHIYL